MHAEHSIPWDWFAWLALGFATAGLLAAYETLPASVPLTREMLTGQWATWALKSVSLCSAFR